MRLILESVLKTVTQITVDLIIRISAYNRKGKSLSKDLKRKVFDKVWDYYNKSVNNSNRSLIRALLQARRDLLHDIKRLTVSSYTIPVNQLVNDTTTIGKPKTKKSLQASVMTISGSASKDALEEAFINNYPSLKSLKSTIFSLDSKLDTLKLIQKILIITVNFSFLPLFLITIYIYLIKVLSWGSIFLGTGYGILRFYNVEIEANDLTKLMELVRDKFISFWNRFINRAFGVELINKEEVARLEEQAYIKGFEKASEDAYKQGYEEGTHDTHIINDTLSSKVYSRTASQPVSDGGQVGEIEIDSYVHSITNHIYSWLPSYDAVVTTSIVTVATITALGALAIYLHNGGTLAGHEDNVKNWYKTVGTYCASYFLGSGELDWGNGLTFSLKTATGGEDTSADTEGNSSPNTNSTSQPKEAVDPDLKEKEESSSTSDNDSGSEADSESSSSSGS